MVVSDIRDENDVNNPCPWSDISEFHMTGIDDVKVCALAIAYNDNVTDIQPGDFTVFSVNQTCVWTIYRFCSTGEDSAMREDALVLSSGCIQCVYVDQI